jgi:hypothetical protein
MLVGFSEELYDLGVRRNPSHGGKHALGGPPEHIGHLARRALEMLARPARRRV